MIKQFCESVNWGHLDYLIVDTPPGTSDEHLSVLENLPTGRAIIVTTPQLISLQDVQKEINFCRTTGLPIIGIVENMSGYVCPHCDHCTNVFSSGGGEALARQNELPFLATLPICTRVGRLLEGSISDANEIIDQYRQTELYPLFTGIIKQITE